MKNPFENPGQHLKAKAEMETGVGDHYNNLYDEDEDRAGQRLDDATGKFIDNSTDTLIVGLSETSRRMRGSKDALGPVPEDKNDAAAIFLREHDKAA